MYPVRNASGYEDILESDLTDTEKKIECLMYRIRDEDLTPYIDPFNECAVHHKGKLIAQFDNPYLASMYALMVLWYPQVYNHIRGNDEEQRITNGGLPPNFG